ncbi:MAG: hypothetical protein IPN34_18665 [Planctomycetes bacterium]|nr:hypothetical protein [Planctomycetota bacterium]
MNQQRVSRAQVLLRRALAALAPAALSLAALVLVTSCSSTFDFHVRTATPAAGTTPPVESVFVFFAKETEFAGKTDSASIATLVHPSTLKQVYGYAEFGLLPPVDQAPALWQLRSSELRGLQLSFVDAREPLELRFRVDRANFETYKDLSLGIVVRTTSREYRLKTWPPSFLQGSDRGLLIEVNDGEIQSSSL